MSNTTNETKTSESANSKAAAAAKAFLEGRKTEPAAPKQIIAKPANLQLTPEQLCTERTIHNCRREILNIDEAQLKESVLGAVSNRALDDESRLAIVSEIRKGRKHLPKDYDGDEDGLVIESARELIVKTISKPAELIKGILYQGGKMSYNAPS